MDEAKYGSYRSPTVEDEESPDDLSTAQENHYHLDPPPYSASQEIETPSSIRMSVQLDSPKAPYHQPITHAPRFGPADKSPRNSAEQDQPRELARADIVANRRMEDGPAEEPVKDDVISLLARAAMAFASEAGAETAVLGAVITAIHQTHHAPDFWSVHGFTQDFAFAFGISVLSFMLLPARLIAYICHEPYAPRNVQDCRFHLVFCGFMGLLGAMISQHVLSGGDGGYR